MSGAFVISLDFELLWGVRDRADRSSYGRNILGGRAAIPRMLALFEHYRIRATWATVGFLFAEDRDALHASLPPEELRPRYANPALSPYPCLDSVGRDERDDPYHYGLSLIRQIAETPGQEIGTHTLSHYYCLEPGQSLAAFEADLKGAIGIAARHGIRPVSIVFPRNQYAADHLEICRRHGITHWRGNPAGWTYRATPGTGQHLLRRGLRLIDGLTGALGAHSYPVGRQTDGNVPASRFLRPKSGRLARFHPAHVGVIKRGLRQAARTGRGYHLWWHPHNFGADTDDNLAALKEILVTFAASRDSFGMRSEAMGCRRW